MDVGDQVKGEGQDAGGRGGDKGKQHTCSENTLTVECGFCFCA